MVSMSQILSYTNSAMTKIPNYGKVQAALFVGSLLSETYVRNSENFNIPDSIRNIGMLKAVQVYVGATSNPGLSSLKAKMAIIVVSLLSFNPTVLSKIGPYMGAQTIKKNTKSGKLRVADVIPLLSDRPPVISFFSCASEAVNIASKIFNSIGTGVIAQKMFNGQTEGKVRAAVTVALLALSAYNVGFTFQTRL